MKTQRSKPFRYLTAFSLSLLFMGIVSFISVNQPKAIPGGVSSSEVASFGDPPTLFPLKGAKKPRITSAFGMCVHPVDKKESFHKGVDIAAPQNTQVIATADGKVREAGNLADGRGNYIIIDHDASYSTAHNQLASVKVKPGQMVKQGEVIGFVGSSGTSSGPHLHYEVMKDGAQVDPQLYFSF